MRNKVFGRVLIFTMIFQMIFMNVGINTHAFEIPNDAAVNSAVKWLKQTQNPDGSWGTDLPLLETSAVLSKVSPEVFADNTARDKALSWIQKQKIRNNDDRSRYLSIPEIQLASGVDALVNRMGSDGGWPLSEAYSSNIYDTLLAAETLLLNHTANINPIKSAINYILPLQNYDGGWSYIKDAAPSLYLTAHIIKVLDTFRSKTRLSSEELEIALKKGRQYLLSNLDADNTCGLTKERIKATFYAYEAVRKTDETLSSDMLNKILSTQGSNGSIYNSPELTALFINLLQEDDDDQEISQVEIEDIKIYSYVGSDKREGEPLIAYTDIFFDPILKNYDETQMSYSIIIKDLDAQLIPAEYSSTHAGEYFWNTARNKPGTYSVFVIVYDLNTGIAMDIFEKQFDIQPSFCLQSASLTLSPKYFRLGSAQGVKIGLSLLTQSNTSGVLTVKVVVADETESEIFIENTSTLVCGIDDAGGASGDVTAISPIDFFPTPGVTDKYLVKAMISDENGVLLTTQKVIEVFPPEPEAKTEIDYRINKKMMIPGKDSVTLTFNVAGIGNPDLPDRPPVDLVLSLDDSGSMSGAPWTRTKEAAIEIVSMLQPQDRCAIDLFNRGTIINLTSDINALQNAIRNAPNASGGTPMARSVIAATNILKTSPPGTQRIIMLLSDGAPDNTATARDSVTSASNEEITVHTFGIGSVNQAYMQQLATIGGGAFVYSPSATQIVDMMTEIAGEIFDVSGTNAKLTVTLPNNIFPISNTEITPSPTNRITNADGSVTLEWDYKKIVMGKTIDIGLTFQSNNLPENQTIVLAYDIALIYTDKTDTEIVLDIDPIMIPVGGYRVVADISTDRPEYWAEEDVNITLFAKNYTDPMQEFTGVMDIIDNAGASVTVIDDGIVLNEVHDETQQNYLWNSGLLFSGKYGARLNWYLEGNLIYESVENFIINPTGQLANMVSSDKIEYSANEEVVIRDRISNSFVNYYPSDLVDTVVIEDSSGNVVFSQNIVIGNMFDSFRENIFRWNTAGTEAGQYTIKARLWENGKEVSYDSCTIDILASDMVTVPERITFIKGSIELSPKVVQKSENVNASYSLKNHGNTNISDIETIITVIEPTTLKTVFSMSQIYSLAPDQEIISDFIIPTTDLNDGEYLVLYNAKINNSLIPLNGSGFFVGSLTKSSDITGTLVLSNNKVEAGTALTLQISLKNISGIAAYDIKTKLTIQPLSGGAVEQIGERVWNLNPNAEESFSLLFSTADYSVGEYVISYYSVFGNADTLLDSQLLTIHQITDPLNPTDPKDPTAPADQYANPAQRDAAADRIDPLANSKDMGFADDDIPLGSVKVYQIECIDSKTSDIIYTSDILWSSEGQFYVFAPKLNGWVLTEDEIDYQLVYADDLPETIRFYYHQDSYGTHNQYLFGYPDNTIRMDGEITRAEVAALMFRLIQDDDKEDWTDGDDAMHFTDVSASHWAIREIQYISNLKLVIGYPGGQYRPENPITREEFIKIATIYANLNPENSIQSTAGTWSKPYIDNALSNSFITGHPDGNLGLTDSLTRAQAVAILNRILNRKCSEDEGVLLNTYYSDASAAHWAFNDIAEAAATHRYSREGR